MAKAFRPLFEGHIPSLGYTLLDWIHEYTCHGPGDVQGEPLDWDDEIREFVIECYRLDPVTGRRLYSEAVLSRPKGRAKSEVAGIIVCAEALAEVRFDGWDADGQPVGRPITSPLIKCLATEESQAGNTFENAAFILGEWGPDTFPEIYGGTSCVRKYQSASAVYLPQSGEVRACTSGSASKDGGKETFVVPDESHLYVLPELKSMYATVMRNLPKRKAAEPWGLQTTTAYGVGELSIAEEVLTAWRKGELGPRVYVNHREAKGKVDIHDRERTIAQLLDVYGPAMDPLSGWMLADDVYETMIDPTKCRDEATAARYYLNRSFAGKDAWLAKDVHERQMVPGLVLLDGDVVVEGGTAIAVGFDGSLNDDSTVLRGCRMSDGFRFRLGVWAKPSGVAGIGWEVPRREVLDRIRWTFSHFEVVRGYFDPHEWRTDIDDLATEFGTKKVFPWATTRDVQMAAALDRLHADLVKGSTFHEHSDTDPLAHEHYGNAYKQQRGRHTLVRKENPTSSRKIDTVVGDALAYEARADAIADGWKAEKKPRKVTVM
jgi:hypothetical protein